MIPLKEYSKPPPHGPKEMETQELPNKRFKINVLKILRELQENISKQQSNIRKPIHKQNENINKELENIKKNQTEILELTNTMTEMKNSIKIFNSSLNKTEERIGELKGKSFEIIQSDEQMKKSKKE